MRVHDRGGNSSVAYCQLRGLHRRAAHPDVRVAPRAETTAAAQILITHIDSAGKSLVPVDHDELAMVVKVELKAIAPSPRRFA